MMLIEVMAAIAILSIAGAALLATTSEAIQRLDRARQSEAELGSAERLLGMVTLWPRDDLDRRLGVRRQGQWLLEIERESSSLYVVTVRDTVSRAALISTAMHRGAR
jgi:type II secretory pathway pseudopilin PulG